MNQSITKKILKTKVKSHGDKVIDFYNKEINKDGF